MEDKDSIVEDESLDKTVDLKALSDQEDASHLNHDDTEPKKLV